MGVVYRLISSAKILSTNSIHLHMAAGTDTDA